MKIYSLAAALLIAGLSSNPLTIKRSANPLPQEVLSLFSYEQLQSVGKSTANICNGDYTINSYSCVSADLAGLGYSPAFFNAIYTDSRIVTMSDDSQMSETFIYVFRKNKNEQYDLASLSLNSEDFFSVSTDSISPSFFDLDLEAISVSSDFSVIKYKLMGLQEHLEPDFYKQSERNYVLREIASKETGAYLPSAINYAVGNDTTTGELKVIQTNLNAYRADQFLCENYIHVADKIDSIPLDYDSQIMGQFILLFNLWKDEKEFKNKLRAVEIMADEYQYYGATRLPVKSNTERGEQVVKQMISTQWPGGEAGCLDENFHKVNETKSKSLTISPDPHKITYKPSYWHFWRSREYYWNNLDFTANFDKANKYVATELLAKYKYYAVLNTFYFEVSPSGYKAQNGKSYWQFTPKNPTSDGKLYLPYAYENVSIARFWWEEDSELRSGIVMSEYNDSFGTVKFASDESTSMPNLLIWIIAIGAILVLVLVVSLFSIFAGPIKILFHALGNIFVGIFKIITWPIRFFVRKVRGD